MEWTIKTIVIALLLIIFLVVVIFIITDMASGSHSMIGGIQEFFHKLITGEDTFAPATPGTGGSDGAGGLPGTGGTPPIDGQT